MIVQMVLLLPNLSLILFEEEKKKTLEKKNNNNRIAFGVQIIRRLRNEAHLCSSIH